MKKVGKNITKKRPQLGVPCGMKNKGSGRGMFKAHLKVFETFFILFKPQFLMRHYRLKGGRKNLNEQSEECLKIGNI